MRRYALRDDQWERIQHLLPGRTETVGVTAKDNRLFVDAVLYRYRAGIPWRNLPECFGNWQNVYNRYNWWSKTNIWENVFRHLSHDSDNEYEMIDSTIVRAHQHSAGAKKNQGDQAIGRSREGLSTKIHALVDALGNPTQFVLTGGQAHDLEGADVLAPQMQSNMLLADKAYDAEDRVLTPLCVSGKIAVIPQKKGRKRFRFYDKWMYQARHLIENFFAKLKQYRAIATSYDKLAQNFLSGVYIAATITWLN